MFITLFSIIFGSILFHILFKKKWIPLKYDVAKDFRNDIPEVQWKKLFTLEGVEVASSKSDYEKVIVDGQENHEMAEKPVNA